MCLQHLNTDKLISNFNLIYKFIKHIFEKDQCVIHWSAILNVNLYNFEQKNQIQQCYRFLSLLTHLRQNAQNMFINVFYLNKRMN